MDQQPRPTILNKDPISLSKILFEGQAIAMAPSVLSVLVPQRVREVAQNPDKIEIQQLRNEKGEVSLLVVEKDYPQELTNAEAYAKWQEDIKAAMEAQKNKPMKVLPNPPLAVNRLHAKFRSEIDQRRLSINDRVLMTCKFRIYPYNKKALYMGDFDGETKNGIGQDFYMNTLPNFAKNLGLRFIVGENRMANYTFFKDKLKRYAIDELKPEFRDLFIENENELFTIQFLYPEDIEKYVENK